MHILQAKAHCQSKDNVFLAGTCGLEVKIDHVKARRRSGGMPVMSNALEIIRHVAARPLHKPVWPGG
jgi:hypothetical protein